MKFKKGIIGLCSALILLFSSQSMAGIYTDRLTQCIVNNTTQEDEIVFIKWMYFAMSQHPELKPYQKITQEQQIKSNQDIAGVLRHLFMEACTKELKAAMKYESSNYLQSFEVFGRTAMVNILSDPSVQKEINAVGEYFGDMDLSLDD